MSVKFGVIGLRRGQSFVRVCRAAQGAEVTALFDIDADKVKNAAEEIGATPYSDFEAFLNSDIEAVVVASPVPFHAEQAIAALKAGKHVLSEVVPSETLEDAKALVQAVRESSGIYMLAENYRYLDEVELLKRMHDDGRFGDVYYLEGEYLHDCRDLWFDSSGKITWRGAQTGKYDYCTHSLGPLLYITGERIDRVTAMAVPGGKFHPEAQAKMPTFVTTSLQTPNKTLMRIRVDGTSPRPHQMAYYQVQGTKGAFESWRGGGDVSKVWLEDTHEESHVGDSAKWHPVSDFAETYIPERLNVPAEARLGGHGTSEYWLLKDFLAAVRGEIAPPIDIYRALDYALPGIISMQSVAKGGVPLSVPDPRDF